MRLNCEPAFWDTGQMRGSNQRRQFSTGRTPKVFQSSYRPAPPSRDWSEYRRLKPVLIVLVVVVAVFLLAKSPLFQIRTVLVSDESGQPLANQGLINQLVAFKGQSVFSSAINRELQQVQAAFPEVD